MARTALQKLSAAQDSAGGVKNRESSHDLESERKSQGLLDVCKIVRVTKQMKVRTSVRLCVCVP